jgi:hypothetical protein
MTVADCGDIEGRQRHAHDRSIDCFHVVRDALGACSSLPSHSDRVDAVDGLGRRLNGAFGAACDGVDRVGVRLDGVQGAILAPARDVGAAADA